MLMRSLLMVVIALSGCNEAQNLRTRSDAALKGEQNAQQVGDESGFIGGDDETDTSVPPVDADPVQDLDDVDSSDQDNDPQIDPTDEQPTGSDPSTEDKPEKKPPVLKTTKDPGFGSPNQSPGQSPGQAPWQNPFQGGVDHKEPLKILELNYFGEGCPEDSVATNISDDQQAFTILFSEFYVEFFSKKGPAPQKHCRVSLTLDVPPGYQVSVFKTDLRGYADLNAGQSAIFYSDYAFDARQPVSLTDEIEGPTGQGGDFELNHTLDVETWVWSRCGATYDLDIDLTVLIESPVSNEPAVVTVDSLDGELRHKMGLVWRACD